MFGSVYNASKAALHAYSNTLRVELAPFDVKVVIVVTGGVKSNIARVDRVLPPDSVYIPIEPEYLRRTKHSQELGIPNDKYARQVVASIVGGSKPPREVWNGYGALYVWFVSNFLPRSVMVGLCLRLPNPVLIVIRTGFFSGPSTCGSSSRLVQRRR